jgi:uncharacterized protein
MLERTAYPPGVPCWIDITQPDVEATKAFYGGLFGWTFDVRTPPDAPTSYAYALLDGRFVAAVAGPPGESDPPGWTSYVCVESAEATAALVEANGGKVLTPTTPVGPPGQVTGHFALCADPEGALVGLWQPGTTPGVATVNVHGSWNFSELHAADAAGAQRFYGAVFGWELSSFAPGEDQTAGFWRVPGYGDFLAERDPEIRERQASDQAPPGFEDAAAVLAPVAAEGSDAAPRWTITFAVDDADAAYARALGLGATEVVPLFDTDYTRQGTIRDPQGAELTVSEYRPPSGA